MRQPLQKYHWVCVVDHLLLGMRPTLKCGLSTQWDSVGENGFFFCKQLLTSDSFWLRGWGLLTNILIMGNDGFHFKNICSKKKTWTMFDRISSGEWKEQIVAVLCHGLNPQFSSRRQNNALKLEVVLVMGQPCVSGWLTLCFQPSCT